MDASLDSEALSRARHALKALFSPCSQSQASSGLAAHTPQETTCVGTAHLHPLHEPGYSPTSCSPLAVLTSDVLLQILQFLDAPSAAVCGGLSSQWHSQTCPPGSVLAADALWELVCRKQWAAQAPSLLFSDVAGFIQHLSAAHPGASWKEMFIKTKQDQRRSRLTKAERRGLCWLPCQRSFARRLLQQPRQQLARDADCKRCNGCKGVKKAAKQRVMFALGLQRPRLARPGTVYDVGRSSSGIWVLTSRHCCFVARQAPEAIQTADATHVHGRELLQGADAMPESGVLTPTSSSRSGEASPAFFSP
mmetsp:Transcript_6915/g.15137  ORF Transcript_6915/g.15137 Transcript_6915/m.15137 type:complete len:307 (+) Transcript_6915:61-981(+)